VPGIDPVIHPSILLLHAPLPSFSASIAGGSAYPITEGSSANIPCISSECLSPLTRQPIKSTFNINYL